MENKINKRIEKQDRFKKIPAFPSRLFIATIFLCIFHMYLIFFKKFYSLFLSGKILLTWQARDVGN